MLTSIRRAFLSGVVLLAPLGITFFVFNWLVLKIGGSFKAKVFFFLPKDVLADPKLELFWNVTATIMVVFLVTLLGFLSRYFVAKYLWSIGERLLNNLPVVNTVYTAKPLKNIFVPTTPNPTSGFLVMLPEDQVQELDMSVGEGMKFIISGGAVVPEWKKTKSLEIEAK